MKDIANRQDNLPTSMEKRRRGCCHARVSNRDEFERESG